MPIDPNDNSKFNFEVIQRYARLKNKSIASISTFFEEFVNVCKYIKNNKLYKKQKPRPGKKSAAAAAAAAAGENTDFEVAAADPDEKTDVPVRCCYAVGGPSVWFAQ